jgi:hypothetical protein
MLKSSFFVFLYEKGRDDCLAQIQINRLHDEEGVDEYSLLVFVDVARLDWDGLRRETKQLLKRAQEDTDTIFTSLLCCILDDQWEQMVMVCDLSHENMQTQVYAWGGDPPDQATAIEQFRQTQLFSLAGPSHIGQLILMGFDRIPL